MRKTPRFSSESPRITTKIDLVSGAIVVQARKLTPVPDLTIMVTSFKEERDYPRYDLRQVHTLAAQKRVAYASRSVVRDALNLGYGLDDVCCCLQELKSSNFRHSGRYEGPLWYDVYRARFTSPARICG